MLNSILNYPTEAAFIGSLVVDHADLQLMMPSAELPFNEAQWLSKMDQSSESLSFKVLFEGELGRRQSIAFVTSAIGKLSR